MEQKRTNTPIRLGTVIIAAAIIAGCSNIFGSSDGGSSTVPIADLTAPDGFAATRPAGFNAGQFEAFEDAFLQSFELEKSIALDGRAANPVVVSARSALAEAPADGTVGAAATVPVWSNPTTFTAGSIADYPEPGLTTAYTVAGEGTTAAGKNFYRIVSTTTYPASNDLVERYVEEYFVLDEAPLGQWGIEDPIVNATGEEDPKFRARMEVHFRDGTVRYEQIVDLVEHDDTEAGFAAFDINASMYYPDFAYPARDPDARFSSIVVYTQDISEAKNYWFWEGTIQGAILGVRYYTEHFIESGAYYQGTTAAYERAIQTFTTIGGSLTDQLTSVFVGSEHVTLAETVLRKEVVFPVVDGTPQSGAAGANTVMRTHVVDTTSAGGGDFLVQMLNNDAALFADWENAPYHIPSGTTAQEIEFNDGNAAVVVETSVTNPDGPALPLIVGRSPAGSELATLYTSIDDGALTSGITGGSSADIQTTDLPNLGANQTLVSPVGSVAVFDGKQGVTFGVSDDPALNPTTEGTVEAWVYVVRHANWAGIVHKGTKHDFSDEGYTLQFWGRRGNVAFGIVDQNPYRYSIRKSNIRLNTGKWYYLVGRWDSSTVYLDIFYENGANIVNKFYSTNNDIGAPYVNSGPLAIGSQFMEGYGRNGFYGFDGKINGVVISTYMKSGGQGAGSGDLDTFYAANRSKPVDHNW